MSTPQPLILARSAAVRFPGRRPLAAWRPARCCGSRHQGARAGVGLAAGKRRRRGPARAASASRCGSSSTTRRRSRCCSAGSCSPSRAALVHERRAHPRAARRSPRGRRQRGRGDARRRHPVLLVLGGPGVHRVRLRRRAARRDAVVPDRQPAGQRGRRRAAVRPVRLADRRPVHRLRPGRLRSSPASCSAACSSSATSSRSCSRRTCRRARPVRRPDLERPLRLRARRGAQHPRPRSGPTCWPASRSARSSTAGCPPTRSPASPARTTRSPSPPPC